MNLPLVVALALIGLASIAFALACWVKAVRRIKRNIKHSRRACVLQKRLAQIVLAQAIAEQTHAEHRRERNLQAEQEKAQLRAQLGTLSKGRDTNR